MNAKLSQDVDPCGKDSGKKEAFAPTEASGFEGKGWLVADKNVWVGGTLVGGTGASLRSISVIQAGGISPRF